MHELQFGRSSEKLDTAIAQLELALEELEAQDAAKRADAAPTKPVEAGVLKPARRPLPAPLPREVVVHPPACACPRCGGELSKLGVDVTELLDYRPASFHVIRHVREKLACRTCEAITQAPMPSLPIRRGRATRVVMETLHV